MTRRCRAQGPQDEDGSAPPLATLLSGASVLAGAIGAHRSADADALVPRAFFGWCGATSPHPLRAELASPAAAVVALNREAISERLQAFADGLQVRSAAMCL